MMDIESNDELKAQHVSVSPYSSVIIIIIIIIVV